MEMARARARNNYLQMHCPPFINTCTTMSEKIEKCHKLSSKLEIIKSAGKINSLAFFDREKKKMSWSFPEENKNHTETCRRIQEAKHSTPAARPTAAHTQLSRHGHRNDCCSSALTAQRKRAMTDRWIRDCIKTSLTGLYVRNHPRHRHRASGIS